VRRRARRERGRDPAAKPHRGAAGGVAGQAAWNYLVFALSKSSTLVMTVVLARLLAPSDFGLFALAMLVLNVFDYLRDLGVAAALVQRKEAWERLAPTGLTLSCVFGVAMAGAAVGLAPFLAAALGEPALTEITRVLAVGLLIASASSLPHALLRRRLDFRGRLIPEVIGAAVKTGVSIGLAATGVGVWSLVWGQLAANAVTTVLYWVVGRPRARLGFDPAVAGSLLSFGLPVTSIGLLSFIVFNAPTAAIGRNLGSNDLGLYTLAYRLPELLILNLCIVIGEVLFSAMSRMQDDRSALGEQYLKAVSVVMTLTAPLGLGMAAVAEDLVVMLFGERYAPGGDVLALLAAYTVIYAASFHSGDAYKAMGRPMILTLMTIGGLVVLIPSVWLASRHSIVAVAATLLILEIVHFTVRVGLVRWVLGLPLRRQLAACGGPLVAAACMALVVWAAGRVLPAWASAARIALLVPLGAVVYLGLLRLASPTAFAIVVAPLRRLARRAAGRSASTSS
jgi:PST family polysaccharide transporter